MRMFKVPLADVDLQSRYMKALRWSWPSAMKKVRQSPLIRVYCKVVSRLRSFSTFSSMPCYACSRLQDRMRILATDCRSARIWKETTIEMTTVINSKKYLVHWRYLTLCLHTRGHAKVAKRCVGIHGLVWNAVQREENTGILVGYG